MQNAHLARTRPGLKCAGKVHQTFAVRTELKLPRRQHPANALLLTAPLLLLFLLFFFFLSLSVQAVELGHMTGPQNGVHIHFGQGVLR